MNSPTSHTLAVILASPSLPLSHCLKLAINDGTTCIAVAFNTNKFSVIFSQVIYRRRCIHLLLCMRRLAPCSHRRPSIIPKRRPRSQVKIIPHHSCNSEGLKSYMIRGRSVIDVLNVRGLTTQAVTRAGAAAPSFAEALWV